MDPGILASLSDRIAGVEDHKLDSILVVRNGNLVFEEYYNGYSRDTPRDIRSVTKSITSILTGIALDEGALDDVDEAAARYLTDGYPDARNHGDMTIRHLLTMRTGLDCNDSDRRTRGHEDRMYRSRDWVAYFLGLARVDAAGTTARYCTGGVVALGETIAAGAGEPVDLFAERTLFAPLGIENYRWERFDRGTGIDTGGHLWINPKEWRRSGSWFWVREYGAARTSCRRIGFANRFASIP
ncbi:MAG: beta-lactamase family protein [Spirochaetales bacterium]|nr:beta-lactamase family protein [Spirochaetales bacterium]